MDYSTTALSHQHEEKNSDSGFWSAFDPIAEYGKAFTESVRILFSNSVSISKRTDLIIKLLDPIVDYNRRLFWFFFPEEDDGQLAFLSTGYGNDSLERIADVSSAFDDQSGQPELSNFDSKKQIASSPLEFDGVDGPSFASLNGSGPVLGIPDDFQPETAWWMAVLAALVVMFIPSILILILRRRHSLQLPRLVTLGMLAFAAGGLLGDCCFHMFPAIFSEEKTSVSLGVFLGIFSFWVFELAIHGHSSESEAEKKSKRTTRSSTTTTKESSTKSISGSAALQVSADILHNFCDGLALAASWSSAAGGNLSLGLSTTLAVILHEIPHELGDVATLHHVAGWTLPEALQMQLITSAIGSFGGLVLGLVISRLSTHSSILVQFLELILPFSAGSFCYLALAIIIPQLRADSVALDVRQKLAVACCGLCGASLLLLVP